MKENNDKKVSIIIPVYNIEPYIGECIESCLRQTYNDFEMILINDGSTDSSGKICDEYAQKDKRIHVIHQENQGLSEARNNGMEIAKGEYIFFVDGDDAITDNALSVSIDSAEKYNSDIVYFQFQRWNGETIFSDHEEWKNHELLLNSEECLELLLQRKMCEMVWHGLYRKSVIDGIKFPVGKINEDVYWKYKIIHKAKCIKLISDNLYLYRMRSDSIMNQTFSWKNFDCLDGAYSRALEISWNYPSLKVLAYSEVWASCISYYYQVMKNFKGKEQKKAIRKILNYKKNLPIKFREILKDRKISKERKITLLICKISIKLSSFLKHLTLIHIYYR